MLLPSRGPGWSRGLHRCQELLGGCECDQDADRSERSVGILQLRLGEIAHSVNGMANSFPPLLLTRCLSSVNKLVLSGLENSATWIPNKNGSKGVAATYAIH